MRLPTSQSRALRLATLSPRGTQCLYASRRLPRALSGPQTCLIATRYASTKSSSRAAPINPPRAPEVRVQREPASKYAERPIRSEKLKDRDRDQRNDKRKLGWYLVGFVGCLVGIATIGRQIGPSRREADAGDDAQSNAQRETGRQVVVLKQGDAALQEGTEDVVETGHSVVPTFPKFIDFPDHNGTTSYQLVGVGIRTVSFLSISVYVGGIYVAKEDIDRLEKVLVKKINPIATTLVADEKTKLKELLLNPVEGERVWNELLKESGVRSVIRIVPVRDTDFPHLRDGWVRGITARAAQNKAEFGDELFGESLNKFKSIFSRGTVKKQRVLAFSRDARGQLDVWFDDGKEGLKTLGSVSDERISRTIWLLYLAGKNVSSEPLRKSVIDGVMGFVERPVGTLATQVHV